MIGDDHHFIVDWSRVGPWLLGSGILGVAWILIRWQASKITHMLFVAEPNRALDTVMDTLRSDKGRQQLLALNNELYAERIRVTDETLDDAVTVAHANRDALAAVSESQKLQGAAIHDITGKVADLPRFITAVESLSRSMGLIDDRLQKMNVSLERMDEREQERQRVEERRWHEQRPNPGRRSKDPS